MIHRTRWLCIIPLILGVSMALVTQHRGQEQGIWSAREARGVLHEHRMEALSANAVATVRTAHAALEQERWAEAAVLTPADEIAGSHVPLVWAVTYFTRAVGAARIDQMIRARQELEELQVLWDGLVATRQRDWAAHVEFLFRVAAAWLAQRQGQYAEARLIFLGD